MCPTSSDTPYCMVLIFPAKQWSRYICLFCFASHALVLNHTFLAAPLHHCSDALSMLSHLVGFNVPVSHLFFFEFVRLYLPSLPNTMLPLSELHALIIYIPQSWQYVPSFQHTHTCSYWWWNNNIIPWQQLSGTRLQLSTDVWMCMISSGSGRHWHPVHVPLLISPTLVHVVCCTLAMSNDWSNGLCSCFEDCTTCKCYNH